MSDEPWITGIRVRVPTSSGVLDNAELWSHLVTQLEANVADLAARDGREVSGGYTLLTTWVRQIKERHHEHGWQMVDQQCSAEVADAALVTMECTTKPREKASA